jgi:hypothetical protein
MDATGESEGRGRHEGDVDTLAWFGPLLQPAWLLPAAREGAPRVALAAERWSGDHPVDQNGRDLRLGLPLFLAEAIRYLTNAVPSVSAGAVDSFPDLPAANTVVLTSVSPDGVPGIRVRLIEPGTGEEREPIEHVAMSDADLGAALTSLPRAVVDALRAGGVGSSWDPRYTAPSPAVAAWTVRGHGACVRLSDPATFEDGNAEHRALARDEARGVLHRLADMATSSDDVLPAVLFFAAFQGATRAGMDAANDFRIAVNSRCIEAKDPRDPIFRLSVLLMRTIGDEGLAERRAQQLGAVQDVPFQDWLARARTSWRPHA